MNKKTADRLAVLEAKLKAESNARQSRAAYASCHDLLRDTSAKSGIDFVGPITPRHQQPGADTRHYPRTVKQRIEDILKEARAMIASGRARKAESAAAPPAEQAIAEPAVMRPTPNVPPPTKAVLPVREMAMPRVARESFMGIR